MWLLGRDGRRRGRFAAPATVAATATTAFSRSKRALDFAGLPPLPGAVTVVYDGVALVVANGGW